MHGFVYIFSNSSMPGLLKIGMTERTPEVRAHEMGMHEGLPTPMIIEYFAFIEGSARDYERLAHQALRDVHHGKEWFKCEVSQAVLETRRALGDVIKYDRVFNNGLPSFADTRKIFDDESKVRQAKIDEDKKVELEKERRIERRQIAFNALEKELLRLSPIAQAAYTKGAVGRFVSEVIGDIGDTFLDPPTIWRNLGGYSTKRSAASLRRDAKDAERVKNLSLLELEAMLQYEYLFKLLKSKGRQVKAWHGGMEVLLQGLSSPFNLEHQEYRSRIGKDLALSKIRDSFAEHVQHIF